MDALYQSAWHHPGIAWTANALLLVFGMRLVPGYLKRFVGVALVAICLDAWLTGALAPPIAKEYGKAVGIAFVILGDLRYFYLLERFTRTSASLPRVLGIATAIAFIVPLWQTAIMQLWPAPFQTSRTIFLSYEALFVLVCVLLWQVLYASRVVFEEGVTVKSVLAASLRSLPGLALARFMQFACIAIGLAFFVVPAAWIGATLLYLGEAFSLERGGAMHAFSRTQRLAGAAFGDAMLGAGLLVTLHAAATLLGDVAGRSALDGLFATTPPEPVWSRGGSLLATVGFWCFVPYAATVKFLLYLNVRTRSEGWDVQTRFAALARRADDDREGRA